MDFILIQKNLIVNTKKIESIEIDGKKLMVTMDSSAQHEVHMPPPELLLAIKKSGVDLTKQFLSV